MRTDGFTTARTSDLSSGARDNRGEHKRIAGDIELVRDVQQGSLEAWHEFLQRYSGLIDRVISRHLPAQDRDERRGVYVDVLKRLYDGDLAKYQGRAPLSTWLALYTRHRSLDVLRVVYGRRRPPKGLNQLSAMDREIFQLYYVERLPLRVVTHMLSWNGRTVVASDIVDAFLRIEKTVDARYLRTLDARNGALLNGRGSDKLQRFIVDRRVDYEQRVMRSNPERELIEEEAGRTIDEALALIAKLPRQEQEILSMRFQHGYEAEQIAEKLGLPGRRKVYTIMDRIIRQLRAALNGRSAAERKVDKRERG